MTDEVLPVKEEIINKEWIFKCFLQSWMILKHFFPQLQLFVPSYCVPYPRVKL